MVNLVYVYVFDVSASFWVDLTQDQYTAIIKILTSYHKGILIQ